MIICIDRQSFEFREAITVALRLLAASAGNQRDDVYYNELKSALSEVFGDRPPAGFEPIAERVAYLVEALRTVATGGVELLKARNTRSLEIRDVLADVRDTPAALQLIELMIEHAGHAR